MIYKGFCISIAIVVGAFLSSCAVTTAPTEASSATIGNTSDATSDLTSSTSNGDDDKKSEDAAVQNFIRSNFDRLRSDMAVGEGEYLASLATLMAIDEKNKTQFYAATKANFSQLFVSSETTPEELAANLQREVKLARI